MRGRLAGLPLFALVGNHGIEPSFAMQDYERAVREHLAELSQRVTQLQGVLVEDKRYSLAVHYRGAHDKSTALRAIRAAAADLSKVFRAIGGKQVLNLVPLGAPHKGTALERLRQESQTDKMLYVGDDMTDEDVFALDQPDRLISVRVGLSKTTRARYYIRSQREIDSLLERLIELRRA
jgi:trehalose 6-phosphate phosphatase